MWLWRLVRVEEGEVGGEGKFVVDVDVIIEMEGCGWREQRREGK